MSARAECQLMIQPGDAVALPKISSSTCLNGIKHLIGVFLHSGQFGSGYKVLVERIGRIMYRFNNVTVVQGQTTRLTHDQ